MNSFAVFSLVFSLLLAIAFADTSLSPVDLTINASKECNISNPVQREPVILISASIIAGDLINLTRTENCHLLCVLQKIGIFDEKYNLCGQALVNYIISLSPAAAKYSDVLIAQTFQLARIIKGIGDKCDSAFFVFYTYSTNSFILGLADELEKKTNVKENIVKAIEKGQQLDKDLSERVEEFLVDFNKQALMFAELAKPAAQPKTSKIPPPLQESNVHSSPKAIL